MDQVLIVLLPTVFLPSVLGFLINEMSLKAAPRLARISDVVDLIGTSAAVVLILHQGLPVLFRVPAATFAATIIITAADMAFGYWAARPNRAEQKAMAAATALGNPALALVVVEVIYHEIQAAVLVSVYIVLRSIAVLPLVLWLRHLATTDR